MSRTFELFNVDTGKSVWIGQGTILEQLRIYTNEEIIKELTEFLIANVNQPLYFVDTEMVADLGATTKEHAREILDNKRYGTSD